MFKISEQSWATTHQGRFENTPAVSAISTPKPKDRRVRPKRILSATTKEQFLTACPGHQGKEIDTAMRKYLIHLV